LWRIHTTISPKTQLYKKEADKMAFLGSSTYSLDTKNRVFVPAKYREDLGNTFYVTRSVDSCLTIYTEDEWNLFLERLDRIPNTAGAAAKEYFMSAAQKCSPDGSGRILLDDTLRTHSQMNKNVVFVGAGRVINVWSEELWSMREATRDLESIRSILQQYEL
jgi:MraZ protein